ncbi:hypothetical protein LR48_Vigan627s001700 [Vigna angularis]|uniref:HMA domain-containing protein n=2 Tax=Phaseolus angularis TaxID=3914 RepID=A0A0S3R8A2_PHAAN|nr:putative inactive cadmium/zinc-transporting ATPase HMA3 [Vigna angularis]XP_052733586.1 putative inactive cadmium/zinc-transporting ATPase HMA3 [Vigna angularis]KAG2407573.1 putative cadmium/zinc-transporting ATPase [Vigna angularis]KOM28968.1 hypothetical protein LR48_Vigan627s001700 [Vigna angularis]BAT76765.1 hypothetical protein VIGAN_01481700 [Vigna angularis var. angularis]
MEKSKKLQKSYFDVLGLCCSSEVPLIENILKPLEGIKEVSVIVPSRTVIVLHDTLVISQLQIVKALNQARLEANIRVHGDQNHGKRWPSPYSIVSGVLLLVSFLKFVYPPFKYVALGAVAAGIYPIVLKAFVSIRNVRVDISILMIIAVIGTIAMDDYLEAGTIVFLFSIAEWLESRASHKATAAMSSLMNIAPQKAVIAETGEVVDADEVKVNTILAVKAGEVIPIDGVVLDGTCEVDEKTLTGESFPVAKQKDSIVWAGTINLNGYISLKTTALAEDCVVAKMTKLVEEAQNSKTNVQTLIDKFVKFYTPAVVIISTLVAVIPLALKSRRENYWFHSALVVLVSACPCALILSTPVATFCAYNRAATSGLLIKGGHHLETLAKIKVMAFDKTGTITKGDFVVTEFQSLSDDLDFNTLLYWVSSVESKSSHPLASAVVDYGRSLSVEPEPEKVTEFENFPGEGISGKMDDRVIYIGNKKIAARAGSETVPILQGENVRGKTTGYIYLGATPVGFFSLSDVCRLGVEEAIGQLKLMGIKTAMLTGDSESAAMQAQEQLGHSLELVHAELLPEDKVKIISEFKKEGPTAMIGDGINDAPALASADIGISMGISGSALASETGNIILMSNDIKKIPEAIKLARKTRWKVLQNIILSITTKAAIIGLAIGGYPYVWAAVVADVGTCLVVIFNSMLLLPRGHKHGGKSCRSSTKSHNHKSGCGGTHDHDHAHHQHQHCHDHHHHQHKLEHDHHHQHKHEHDHHHQHKHEHDHHHQHKHEHEHDLHQHQHDHEHDHHHQHKHEHDHDHQHKHEHDHHHQHKHEHDHDHQHKHEHDHHHQHKHEHEHEHDLHQHQHGHEHDHHQRQDEHDHHYHTDNHCHPIPGCENLKDHKCRSVLHCNQDMNHNKSVCHPNNEKNGTGEISVGIIVEHVESAPMNGCSSLAEKEKGSCCEGCSDTCENLVIVCGCESSKEGEDRACCRNECSSKACNESSIIHGCVGLDKREYGGCCKSYMNECCGKLGHSRTGFVGGLSEIMTE